MHEKAIGAVIPVQVAERSPRIVRVIRQHAAMHRHAIQEQLETGRTAVAVGLSELLAARRNFHQDAEPARFREVAERVVTK